MENRVTIFVNLSKQSTTASSWHLIELPSSEGDPESILCGGFQGWINLVTLVAASCSSVLGKCHSCGVPIGEAEEDEEVPPLVAAAEDVKPPGQNHLRELGNVEEEGKAGEEVHHEHSR